MFDSGLPGILFDRESIPVRMRRRNNRKQQESARIAHNTCLECAASEHLCLYGAYSLTESPGSARRIKLFQCIWRRVPETPDHSGSGPMPDLHVDFAT